MIYFRIPSDKTVSFKALGEWKLKVGMELKNELDPKYDGKAIAVAFFATEEDLIMFKLAFGV